MTCVVINSFMQGLVVTLAGGSYTDTELDPGTAICGIRLAADGTATNVRNAQGNQAISGEWARPIDAGNGALYEARVTVTSGTLTTGTTGTWLALSSQRDWDVQRSTVGSKACTFTLEIRRVSDSVVVASASYTITATIT